MPDAPPRSGPPAAAPDLCPPGSPEEPTRRARLAAWSDMLVSDGGLMRLIYLNLHQVAPGIWRSGQPTPGQLRAFARRGGRTVVSLRAGRGFGSLPLEIEACRAAGLGFHTLPLRSHALPSREELAAAARLFREMARPALLHCKSGADRSGFAAALYLMLVEDRPVAEARRQLALRFGHRRWGKAGLFDAFLDAYERDTAARPMPLTDWAATLYDPAAIAAGFRPRSLGSVVLGRLLRRK